jgi:VWFA-related protein
MKRSDTRPFPTLLGAALLLVAAGPAPAQKTFTGTAQVVVVEIPVTVTVDGEPVPGLSAANFEVLDGRKKQPIVGFDTIDLSVVKPEQQAALRAPIPAAGRRHFLLLFDVSFSTPASLVRAREAAKDLVKEGLHPEDLAAVAVYSVSHGPSLILGFTPDRAQLELALDTLGNPDMVHRANDPLGLVLADPGTLTTAATSFSIARTETSQAVEAYLQGLNTLVDASDRRAMQDQVNSMTRQMADLAHLLDSVDGRKYVVYLSEGFDDSLLVGKGAGLAAGPRASGDLGSVDITDSASTSATTGDAIASGDLANVSSDEMYGSGRVQNSLQKMLQEFVKANCVIEAVDIGGLRAGGSVRAAGSGENSLSAMASETGGEVFRNFNDLSQAMDQMLQKTSYTYLLAIQPEKLKLDGSYHRLKVRLKDAPKGAEIQHRPGYYEPVPLKNQSPVERQMRTASRLLDEAGGGLTTSLLATPFATGEGKAYVPLIIEVDGQNLVAGTSGKILPVEIYAYALDAQGGVHDFFTQALPIDLAQNRAALEHSGLKYYGHLDLGPGDYTVRVLVRNLDTGLSSLGVLPLTVPDFGGDAPLALPPLFPEEMGKWVVVREPAERQRDVPYPFMLKEGPYIPAAAPEMGKSGEVRVPVVAYHLSQGSPPDVKVRLVGADGQEHGQCEVARVERFLTRLPGAQTLVLDLRHSAVAPGEYTLEVTVTDPASGRQVVTSTPVAVAAKG